MIGIRNISTFFPGEQVDVETLLKDIPLNEQEMQYCNSTGISSVHVAEDYRSFDLALGAARNLLDATGLAPEEIDLIIYIKSRLPEHLISSEASRLQFELNATRATSISISDLGCADMSMALKMASDHLKANPEAENVLIVYGCKPYTPSRVRIPVTIHGDGGLAALVGRTEDNQLIDIELKTDGKYWDLFKVEYQNKLFDDFTEECSDHRLYGFDLAIESRNRYMALNKSLLERNGLQQSDIHHFILQNISARAYVYYETAFDLKFSPVCQYNLGRYGHLGPSDILQNLQTGIDNGLFNKGERVLIMNNSPAAVWSNILVEL
jgi:3-oxoacyl-[acyl-carrier-protein] synthase III